MCVCVCVCACEPLQNLLTNLRHARVSAYLRPDGHIFRGLVSDVKRGIVEWVDR